jgi:hypothetical protein
MGKRPSIVESQNSTLKIKSNSEEKNKNVLSVDLVETLITFGFDLKQLMIAHKEYKFSNVDEACYYLMKDNDSGKYNHRFLNDDKNENSYYSNLNKNACVICSGDPTEHYDFNLEDKKVISSNNLNNLSVSHDNIGNFKKSSSYRNSDINLDIYNSNNNLKEKIGDLDCNILNNEDKYNDKFNSGNLNIVNNQNYSLGHSENNDNKCQSNKSNREIISTSVKNNDKGINIQNNKRLTEKFENKLQNVKIEIPPETLDLFDDPDICRICFAEKITQHNEAQFACGHKFCRKCVTNYLTNSIMNGKVKFFFNLKYICKIYHYINFFILINKKFPFYC